MRKPDSAMRSEASPRLRALTLLLVLGTCLAYLDRQVLSLLKPSLQAFFGWSDAQFAHMGSAFSLTTACAIVISGWLVDRFGVRRSYGWAMGLWSLVAMGHALASSVSQFVTARVLLALGESVNGPAAVKATALFLPVEQRSVTLGLVTAATSAGAIVAPLVVPAIGVAFGWQAAFVVTGALGLIWLVFWAITTRQLRPIAAPAPPASSAAADWASLIRSRYAWAAIGGRIVADWVFWVVLFWAPDIFARMFHLSQADLGRPVALTYAMAALGAVAAGFLFPALLRRGLSADAARKASLFGFACLALPLPLVLYVASPWAAAAIIGLTMFAHNAFSTNLFGIIADGVAIGRVARVMALGSVASNVSGSVMIEVAGWCLSQGYGYRPLLLVAGFAYLAAFALIRLVLGRIEPEERRDEPVFDAVATG